MKIDTITASRGRWREILAALGVSEKFFNGKNQPCPLCGGEDRASFNDRDGDGNYFCRQCGPGKGFQFVMKLKGWDFRRAAQEVDSIIGNLPPAKPQRTRSKPKVTTHLFNLMWKDALPVSADDPVGEYLMRRGITISELDVSELRFLTTMPHYPTKTDHPGMLARVRDRDGKPRQLHRTYLTIDGHKAAIVPPRMFMPGELPVGGAIRLGAAAATMGIAEGIETALSAAILFRMPVWATTSAIMLEQWQPPPEAEHVLIFGDSDENYVGQAAAYILAKRLIFEAARDRICRVLDVKLPPHGDDWNDVLLRRARAPSVDTRHTESALGQERPALDEESFLPVP